jgi:hypothetical protein
MCPCSMLATLLKVTTRLAEKWLCAATLGSGIFALIAFIKWIECSIRSCLFIMIISILFSVYYKKSACVQVFQSL